LIAKGSASSWNGSIDRCESAKASGSGLECLPKVSVKDSRSDLPSVRSSPEGSILRGLMVIRVTCTEAGAGRHLELCQGK
jgi:hypothetical protein